MKKILCFAIVALMFTIATVSFAYELDGGSFPSGNIPYVINSSASSYSSEINNAADMWSDNTNVNLWDASDFTGPHPYWTDVVADEYGYVGWDGSSSMSPGWGQTYNIGTIELNETYISDYGFARIKLVTCHEFGHILGLDHVDSYTMMYGNDVWDAWLENTDLLHSPDQDDIDGVNSIY
ncbi:matrixin family metalloprotease [Wukongibacter sp. M2B1]|uniref:matrixin family metalloprotease n=1 Tax=Wukongibacter sp. M2B1 TaxID=3088895 RepID=UPI003D7C02E9